MSDALGSSGLELAVQISQDLLSAADAGDVGAVAQLDAERLQLLQLRRQKESPFDEAERSLLQVIAQLNDKALGVMMHRHRMKAREIDLAAVGRRAVSAYSTTR